MARGISCHIGVNSVDPDHYNGWSGPLNACEYDALDLQGLADSIGYESSLLLTGEATRDAVTEKIQRVADVLTAGDIFFMSYSGHGGQVADVNGDERDLEDETWCLYDGQLIDDELGVLWTKFQEGVRIILLSDSCHSGTVAKMADRSLSMPPSYLDALADQTNSGPAYRMMPVSTASKTYRNNKTYYDQLQQALPPQEDWAPIKASVRLLSGCQDNQLSMDGTFNGAFTGTLLRVFAEGRFQGNYGQFHKDIVRNMPPTQTPNHYLIGTVDSAFDEQKPFQL